MRIPIVNEQDEIIDHKDRDERSGSEICRITAIWVTNEKGEILVAQRALTKRHAPGIWSSAVAGTVEEGETYESNAIKEAFEEIGLRDIPLIESKKTREKTIHEYFLQWYIAVVPSDYPLKKQDEEVEEIRWVAPDDLRKWHNERPHEFVHNFGNYLDLFL